MAPSIGNDALKFGSTGPGEVVEINLLLPAERARELLQLSRHRRQSVAHLLRQIIDRALEEAEPAPVEFSAN